MKGLPPYNLRERTRKRKRHETIDPRLLRAFVAWYDFSVPRLTSLSGSDFSALDEVFYRSSTKQLAQSTANLQPTQVTSGSRVCADFDGAGGGEADIMSPDSWTVSEITGATNRSFYALINPDSTLSAAAENVILDFGKAANDQRNRVCIDDGTKGNAGAAMFSVSSSSLTWTTDLRNAWHVISVVLKGTKVSDVTCQVDGVAEAPSDSTSASDTVNTVANLNLGIGGATNNPGTGGAFKGLIDTVLIYNTAHDANERHAVEHYLAHLRGIAI